MKKIIVLLVGLFIMCAAMAVSAADIPVYVDGAKLEFDVQPQMINDRVMVPMRFIFEKLGATVDYDGETRTIRALYRDGEASTIIMIQIDNPRGFVNSATFELDSPPVEIDGRTLVPVRFVGEALGCIVDWNEQENAVYVKKQVKADDTKKVNSDTQKSQETEFTEENNSDDFKGEIQGDLEEEIVEDVPEEFIEG